MSFETQFRLLMFAGLIVLLLLSAGWIWLCAGARKTGWRRAVGIVALQLSFVTMVYSGLRGATLLDLLLDGLLPPFTPIFEQRRFHEFQQFLSPIYPYALGGSALAVSPFLLRPSLIRWSIVPIFLVTIVIGVVVGETISQTAMCSSAASKGIASFRRHTLLWSLANAPQDFQFEIHAAAEKNGQRLGWSYREMGWYNIPDDASGDVEGPPFVCRQ